MAKEYDLVVIGLLEEDARERGLAFDARYQPTPEWFSSKRIGEEFSGHKVLMEKKSGKILGAHLLGMHSEEMVNLFSLAMHAGLRPGQIKDAIFAYPTKASDMTSML